jgi:hypothetical protein
MEPSSWHLNPISRIRLRTVVATAMEAGTGAMAVMEEAMDMVVVTADMGMEDTVIPMAICTTTVDMATGMGITTVTTAGN